MQNLDETLSEREVDRLDRFLLDRIDDDAEIGEQDEGILNVSELDGLLTALVSGPVVVMPSQWLPAVWGDFPPAWHSPAELEDIFRLMTRHMNGIAATLMQQAEDFDPMFLEREVEGRRYTIVDEWCEGYMRGVGLAAEAWNAGGRSMADLLDPIRAFTSITAWRGHEPSGAAALDARQDKIAPSVRAIYAYWLARREPRGRTTPETVRRSGPRVGRNDPCPCGSGRKYKKCCLN